MAEIWLSCHSHSSLYPEPRVTPTTTQHTRISSKTKNLLTHYEKELRRLLITVPLGDMCHNLLPIPSSSLSWILVPNSSTHDSLRLPWAWGYRSHTKPSQGGKEIGIAPVNIIPPHIGKKKQKYFGDWVKWIKWGRGLCPSPFLSSGPNNVSLILFSLSANNYVAELSDGSTQQITGPL